MQICVRLILLKHSYAVERPGFFFRQNGPMPERASLAIVPPPVEDEIDAATFQLALSAAIKRHVQQARQRNVRHLLSRLTHLGYDVLLKPRAVEAASP